MVKYYINDMFQEKCFSKKEKKGVEKGIKIASHILVLVYLFFPFFILRTSP